MLMPFHRASKCAQQTGKGGKVGGRGVSQLTSDCRLLVLVELALDEPKHKTRLSHSRLTCRDKCGMGTEASVIPLAEQASQRNPGSSTGGGGGGGCTTINPKRHLSMRRYRGMGESGPTCHFR